MPSTTHTDGYKRAAPTARAMNMEVPCITARQCRDPLIQVSTGIKCAKSVHYEDECVGTLNPRRRTASTSTSVGRWNHQLLRPRRIKYRTCPPVDANILHDESLAAGNRWPRPLDERFDYKIARRQGRWDADGRRTPASRRYGRQGRSMSRLPGGLAPGI